MPPRYYIAVIAGKGEGCRPGKSDTPVHNAKTIDHLPELVILILL